MNYTKPPLCVEDQISNLKEKGLIIEDENFAKHILQNISFYRLRAYTYPFQDNKNPEHTFIKKISFEEIIDLYEFDHQLRMLVFEAIVKIEIALRTQIISQWSLTYGSHFHLDKKLYKNSTLFENNLEILNKEIERSNEIFITHYKETYSQPEEPPCWMSLEVASIGTLSLLFKNLKDCPQKKAVAKHFGLHSIPVFENWVHNFCNIRNICAHHSRLWNRKMVIPLMFPKKTQKVFIEYKPYEYKLFASIAAITYILSIIDPKNCFKRDFLNLLTKCTKKQLKEIGVPKEYNKDSFWQII